MELTKSQLVEVILALDLSIGTQERILADLKKDQAKYEKVLVSKMEEDEEQAFVDEDGRKVSREDKMVLVTRSSDRENWNDWITELGRSDLVKTEINKNSLNAIVKAIIKGQRSGPLPDFFNIEKDLFFIPRVSIKIGAKSLRKLASDTGDHQASI